MSLRKRDEDLWKARGVGSSPIATADPSDGSLPVQSPQCWQEARVTEQVS